MKVRRVGYRQAACFVVEQLELRDASAALDGPVDAPLLPKERDAFEAALAGVTSPDVEGSLLANLQSLRLYAFGEDERPTGERRRRNTVKGEPLWITETAGNGRPTRPHVRETLGKILAIVERRADRRAPKVVVYLCFLFDVEGFVLTPVQPSEGATKYTARAAKALANLTRPSRIPE